MTSNPPNSNQTQPGTPVFPVSRASMGSNSQQVSAPGPPLTPDGLQTQNMPMITEQPHVAQSPNPVSYQSISAVQGYEQYSFEELRVNDYKHGRRPTLSASSNLPVNQPAQQNTRMATIIGAPSGSVHSSAPNLATRPPLALFGPPSVSVWSTPVPAPLLSASSSNGVLFPPRTEGSVTNVPTGSSTSTFGTPSGLNQNTPTSSTASSSGGLPNLGLPSVKPPSSLAAELDSFEQLFARFNALIPRAPIQNPSGASPAGQAAAQKRAAATDGNAPQASMQNTATPTATVTGPGIAHASGQDIILNRAVSTSGVATQRPVSTRTQQNTASIDMNNTPALRAVAAPTQNLAIPYVLDPFSTPPSRDRAANELRVGVPGGDPPPPYTITADRNPTMRRVVHAPASATTANSQAVTSATMPNSTSLSGGPMASLPSQSVANGGSGAPIPSTPSLANSTFVRCTAPRPVNPQAEVTVTTAPLSSVPTTSPPSQSPVNGRPSGSIPSTPNLADSGFIRRTIPLRAPSRQGANASSTVASRLHSACPGNETNGVAGSASLQRTIPPGGFTFGPTLPNQSAIASATSAPVQLSLSQPNKDARSNPSRDPNLSAQTGFCAPSAVIPDQGVNTSSSVRQQDNIAPPEQDAANDAGLATSALTAASILKPQEFGTGSSIPMPIGNASDSQNAATSSFNVVELAGPISGAPETIAVAITATPSVFGSPSSRQDGSINASISCSATTQESTAPAIGSASSQTTSVASLPSRQNVTNGPAVSKPAPAATSSTEPNALVSTSTVDATPSIQRATAPTAASAPDFPPLNPLPVTEHRSRVAEASTSVLKKSSRNTTGAPRADTSGSNSSITTELYARLLADNRLLAVRSTGVQTEDDEIGNVSDTVSLATEHIPLALLVQAFGEFVDDVQNFVPTDLERGFLLAVSKTISANPAASLDTFTKLLNQFFGIAFVTKAPGGEAMFSRRAQVANNPFIMIDIGYPSPFASSYVPSMDAYKRYVEGISEDTSTLPALPCLHILLRGASFSIAGSVMVSGTPRFQVLTPEIPLKDYHLHEEGVRDLAARTFGAMANAAEKLKNLYSGGTMTSGVLRAPYQTSYRHLESNYQVTLILDELVKEKKLEYYGREEYGTQVVVQFVRHFCQDIQGLCFSLGYAPRLRGVERMPGGWVMVVTDRSNHEPNAGPPKPNQIDVPQVQHISAERGWRTFKFTEVMKKRHFVSMLGMVFTTVQGLCWAQWGAGM